MKALKPLLTAAIATFLISAPALAQPTTPGPDETTPAVRTTPDNPNEDPDRKPADLGTEEAQVQALKLYPNPSIGSEFTMDLPLNDDEPIAMFVYDMNGRVIDRKQGSYGELRHFRFRHLQEAAYIVKVFSKDILFQSRVLVVHR
ncbi:T9SS type A sorting domain-containing protein [Phaeocystidibacter luteus]|uniref:T9SS type A sorting domain-containing protein n=1 Tax=Phaeocystidibacter luteus TaxID=911197 RepID=A0A6N6RJK2_9FLAO|nr:T9SS type A sorting domain-containing protein [Phaeocystidibacter luteus]KAB2813867.1 T9SS type A sorting domain-containing protein [Phaeocystidibacter luteus]